MTNGRTTVEANEWLSRPLCCRYHLVIFEALPIYMEECGVVYDRRLHWALGVVADGQYEVLGVWPEPVSRVPIWREMFEDLRVRGVEKIRFVLNGDSVALDSFLRTTYPGAAVLPAVRQLGAFVGLSPRYRRMALASEAATKHLQTSASRVIGRHGCISDLAEATGFVVDILEQALLRGGVVAARNAVASRHSSAGAKPLGRPHRTAI